MVFSLRQYNFIDATLAYNNTPILIVSKTKYKLAIALDSKLLWEDHINAITKNTAPAINFLKSSLLHTGAST